MRQETGGENIMRKRMIQQLLSNETWKSGRWKKCFGLLLACSVITLTFDGSVYAAASGENQITAIGEVNRLSSEFDDDEDEKIIPPDDRVEVKNTKKAPFKYVGRLGYKGGAGFGTGALIGRKTVLTAAHCVYGEEANIKRLRFYPGQNEMESPFGEYEIAEIHIPPKYIAACKLKNEEERRRYDYAVVTLKKSLSEDHGYFQLGGDGTSLDRTGIENLSLGLIGYLGSYGGMYRQASKEHFFRYESFTLRYMMDTDNGQSGSPVYRMKNGKYYIVAVHIRGSVNGNGGRYLDSTVKSYIRKYMK